jgi:hypothetical protein
MVRALVVASDDTLPWASPDPASDSLFPLSALLLTFCFELFLGIYQIALEFRSWHVCVMFCDCYVCVRCLLVLREELLVIGWMTLLL